MARLYERDPPEHYEDPAFAPYELQRRRLGESEFVDPHAFGKWRAAEGGIL